MDPSLIFGCCQKFTREPSREMTILFIVPHKGCQIRAIIYECGFNYEIPHKSIKQSQKQYSQCITRGWTPLTPREIKNLAPSIGNETRLGLSFKNRLYLSIKSYHK